MQAKADRPEGTRQSRDSVLAEIKQQVAEHGDAPLASLQEDTDLIADLGYDSLDIAELVMDLEERFDIVVPDDRVDKAPTIRRITDTVMELLR